MELLTEVDVLSPALPLKRELCTSPLLGIYVRYVRGYLFFRFSTKVETGGGRLCLTDANAS